ncbi:MAG: stage II sporulation protein P [Clostridia bacterium]|nr:stage II sporulation protein P [Clostridia bacterium]
MFNVAIINIKDIWKILLKVLLFLFFLIITVTIMHVYKNDIPYAMTYCLDTTIPSIKQANYEEKKTFLLEEILSYELPIPAYAAGKKEIIQEEVKNEDYAIAISEDVTTEVQATNVPETYTDILQSVNIKNGTDFELTDQMLSQKIEFQNSKQILIYHTHTCECYTQSKEYNFETTGNFRTTDQNYNVVRVGEELKQYLENYGYTVIHDKTTYDYPAYTGSYERSCDSVKQILENNPKTEILFDIHRDAIGDSNYAPTVKIGDEYASQLMFVIGSNGGGLEHPNWIQNLITAVKIQRKANEKYPGLFKPLILRNSRYNQHLAKGASIIEVGATGNTLEQSLTSMKYLADVLKDIF